MAGAGSAFSSWSWASSRDKNWRSGQSLTKSILFGGQLLKSRWCDFSGWLLQWLCVKVLLSYMVWPLSVCISDFSAWNKWVIFPISHKKGLRKATTRCNLCHVLYKALIHHHNCSKLVLSLHSRLRTRLRLPQSCYIWTYEVVSGGGSGVSRCWGWNKKQNKSQSRSACKQKITKHIRKITTMKDKRCISNWEICSLRRNWRLYSHLTVTLYTKCLNYLFKKVRERKSLYKVVRNY